MCVYGERDSKRESVYVYTSIPDLGLDGLPIDLNAASSKLHANSALALQVELIPGEPGQEVALTNTRVPYQHHWRGDIV